MTRQLLTKILQYPIASQGVRSCEIQVVQFLEAEAEKRVLWILIFTVILTAKKR